MQIERTQQHLQGIQTDIDVQIFQIEQVQKKIKSALFDIAHSRHHPKQWIHSSECIPSDSEDTPVPTPPESATSCTMTATTIPSPNMTVVPRSSAFTIRILLNGCPTTCIIDTGTIGNDFVSTSFLQANRLESFKLKQRITLHKVGNKKSDTDLLTHYSPLHITFSDGMQDFEFRQQPWKFLAYGIRDYDCILGLEFLRQAKAIIDVANRKIIISSTPKQ